MWMFALATAWSDPGVDPAPPSASSIHSKMDDAMARATTRPTRNKRNTPTVIPCPKNMCRRINHTQQEAYNRSVLESGWLCMANRYGVGHELIPEPQATDPRGFLTWNTDFRALWILMDSGTPTSYYATWTLESLTPTGGPFDPNRLQPLQQTVDRWLSTCNQIRPIDVDHRQNERSWSGTNCNGWDLWLEYTPTEDRALSVLAVQR